MSSSKAHVNDAANGRNRFRGGMPPHDRRAPYRFSKTPASIFRAGKSRLRLKPRACLNCSTSPQWRTTMAECEPIQRAY